MRKHRTNLDQGTFHARSDRASLQLSMSKKARKAEELTGEMSEVLLDWAPDGEKCFKGHYRDVGENLNMNCSLDNSISTLDFLILVIELWLYERMFFITENYTMKYLGGKGA